MPPTTSTRRATLTPDYAADTQLVINLAVPGQIESAAPGSRADVPDSGDPSMTPTTAETRVNDLRLVLVNSANAAVTVRPLHAPDEMPINPDRTATYEVSDLEKGSYYVYVIANLADVIDKVTTKAQLDEALINCGTDGRGLKAGNLPMVFESSAAIAVKGKAEADKAPMLVASMRFACAKMRLSLVFDKENTQVQQMFGESGLMIKQLTLRNLSTNSRVVYTPTYTAPAANSGLALGEGLYYTGFTTTAANATVNDKYVLNPTGTGSQTCTNPANTWAWIVEDIYLPERYLGGKTDTATQLYIEAASTTAAGAQSNVTMNYTIDLGRIGTFSGADADSDLANDKSDLSIVRGKLYEVIGRFKSFNNGEITTDVVAVDWVPSAIDVDMVATYLKLEKTTASVTSLQGEDIAYTTDAKGAVGFECVSPHIGPSAQAPVVMTVKNGILSFAVNPQIDITKFTTTEHKAQLEGTAECYVAAGNIRKLVTVDYDITPFFTVKPLDVKIQYHGDILLATKSYEYQTNLGGIIISERGSVGSVIVGPNKSQGTNTVSKSTIRYDASQTLSQPVGQFTVTTTTNPEVTTVHYLSAYPASAASGQYTEMMQPLTVTVLPELPDYRIYFRAINDYQEMEIEYSGGNPQYAKAKEFLDGNYNNYHPEGGLWNWCDWWTPNVTGNAPNTDHHRVYIYTQMGETTSSGGSMPVWVFTDGYGTNDRNDSYMKADNVNTGWYYFDQPRNDPKTVWYNGQNDTRNPEPGKTLIIFYNNENTNLGYAIHRMAHHNDPGIQLFDYEDREGYYVYDPTMEPYYRVYDEKPDIFDAEYVVYSKTQITGWEHSYGIADNKTLYDDHRQFTIHYDFRSDDGFRTTESVNGSTWHKTTIKLKALRDDKAKALTLKGLSRSSAPQTQYAYYGYSESGFDNPWIYVFRSGGGSGNEVRAWPGEKMSYYLTTAEGVKIYRYEIPSGYENGTVVFNDGNKDNGAKSGDLGLGGQSKLTYSNNLAYWAPYGEQPGNTVVLNDGNDFVGNGPQFIVTFDGTQWYSGKPRH